MVGNRRQGWALYATMWSSSVGLFGVAYAAEQHGSPAQHIAGENTSAASGTTGGNLEGKEQRNGIADSAQWTNVTTDASNGSVNSAHDSYRGIGGLVPLTNMMTGEVIFGGVGSGLYGMLMTVLLAVFIAGLMVGRTPEYSGKKVESREVKLVLIGLLFTPMVALIAAGIAISSKYGDALDLQPGTAGILRDPLRVRLAGEQQRSAFAGYTGFVQPNAPGNFGAYGITFADLLGGLSMLTARFVPLLSALAIAGSLSVKRSYPSARAPSGPTTPTFVILLLSVIVIVAPSPSSPQSSSARSSRASPTNSDSPPRTEACAET